MRRVCGPQSRSLIAAAIVIGLSFGAEVGKAQTTGAGGVTLQGRKGYVKVKNNTSPAAGQIDTDGTFEAPAGYESATTLNIVANPVTAFGLPDKKRKSVTLINQNFGLGIWSGYGTGITAGRYDVVVTITFASPTDATKTTTRASSPSRVTVK
jgi:hypothetical protein